MNDAAFWRELGQQLRVDSIRASDAAGSGHPTSSMSAADVIAVLLAKHLHYDFGRPEDPRNDHLILSKGHACPVLYAVMAQCGYSPVDKLNTLRKLGSIYQGHPDVRFLPALEASTGSLGQGLSLAIGMGMAARLNHR